MTLTIPEGASPRAVLYAHYDLVPADRWPWINFKPAEIASHPNPPNKAPDPDTGALLLDPDAMDALQRLRTAWGIPIIVNCGYRTPFHNACVGGEANSQHMLGKAFDLACAAGHTQEAMVQAALASGFTGIGRYDSFLHVDIGPARSWDFRTIKGGGRPWTS